MCRSIKHARTVAAEEGLTAAYVNQNYLEFETDDQFDIILMIMCDFCALSPAQRMTMLEKFQALLASGGSVLLDVYSVSAFEQREEAFSGTRTIYNWLQYFSPGALQREFEKAGFTQQEFYGNVAGAPFAECASEFAIVGKQK